MSITAEKLISEALNMPIAIRAFVAQRIIESLDIETNEPLSAEWKAEIEKRCREIDDSECECLWVEEAERRYQQYKQGKIASRSSSDVLRDARAALK